MSIIRKTPFSSEPFRLRLEFPNVPDLRITNYVYSIRDNRIFKIDYEEVDENFDTAGFVCFSQSDFDDLDTGERYCYNINGINLTCNDLSNYRHIDNYDLPNKVYECKNWMSYRREIREFNMNTFFNIEFCDGFYYLVPRNVNLVEFFDFLRKPTFSYPLDVYSNIDEVIESFKHTFRSQITTKI